MNKIIGLTAILLTGCINAQPQATSTAESNTPMAHAKPAAIPAAPATRDLEALAAMTFDCPKAALDAAAREAAKVPSQGSYQFSYFSIVNDAHHALYEVHFKSNYSAEPALRYCVAIYCQQGWDPRTTQADVKLMHDEPSQRRGKAQQECAAHAGDSKR
jgi:hypothetical protein